MARRNRRPAVTTEWLARRRDRGAVLPLTLVLIVVGSLIVIPVMSYVVSVLRANRVEQEHTRNVEASKGAIRAALRQPGLAFGDKDRANAGCPPSDSDLLPADGVVVRDVSVAVSCTPVDELSANEVFGFEVPVGAAQLQIAPDPANFAQYSGILASSGEAPPYPTSGSATDWAWWQSFSWQNPLEPSDTKTIWIPELPSFTDESRSSTPLDMPGFDCKVFLPGRYESPLVLDASGASDNFYFASGVYYFEEPVTISGDVDVVVGQGLADFGVSNDCADDIQVGANVVVPANTVYGIDGNSGGATWVFGDQGRLVVTDSGGAPSLRFNQRYATSDRGGWINIMSVNGDWSYDNGDTTDDDLFEDADGDHTATNVNWVPRSRVLQADTDGVITPVPLGDPGALYTPSHPDLTDEARVPSGPTSITGEARMAGGAGAILVTFRGAEGSAANGALVTEYEAGVESGGSAPATPNPTSICSTAGVNPSLFPTAEGADGTNPWGRVHPENAGDPDEYSCLITGLTAGSTYWITARAKNEAGWSDWASVSSVPNTAWATAPPVAPASAPVNVEVQPHAGGGPLPSPALVSWDPPAAANGAPVTGYDVEVYRVYTELIDPSATTTTTTSTTTTTTTTSTTSTTTTSTTTTTTLPPAGPDCGPPLDCPSIPSCPSGDQPVASRTFFGSWQWSCENSCPAGSTLVSSFFGPTCAPLVCDVDERPSRPPFSGSWSCTGLDPTRAVNFGAPTTCPAGTTTRFGYGVEYCSPGSGPVPFRGRPAAPAASSPVVTAPAAGASEVVVPVTGTTAPPSAALGPSVASAAPAFGSPTTTTTTIPLVPVEREELIDVAEAKCSTSPRMGLGADEGLEWTPPPTQCVLGNLPDMPDVGGDGNDNVGYRVKVTARTAAGASAVGSFEPPFKSIPGAPGDLDPAPPERVWFPHHDTSIISIDASGGGTTTIDVPGYISVPMGRVTINNSAGDPIGLTGGVVAGRLVVNDSRSPLTYGYVPSVIMQRTVRISATAGNVRSDAIVRINSDTSYGILRWVTQ